MKEIKLERTYEIVATIQIVTRTNGKYYAEIVRNVDDLWNENEEYQCWVDKDGQLMCEPANTEEEYDAIIDAFREYIENKGTRYARQCTCCGKGMNEGYFAEYEYFCSTSCLYTEYPPNVWENLATDDNDSYYWTQWEDIFDYQYTLFNNQLIETN